MSVACGHCWKAGAISLNDNPKKAISLLQECKSLFTQDGRDSEIQLSAIWLSAAYDEAGLRMEARTEIKELLATGASLIMLFWSLFGKWTHG